MDEPSPGITLCLRAWRGGDERALERLAPLVYGELRRLADRYLDGERAGHTLETHDLVHEAFLRLVGQRRVEWRNRAHFFAIAAQAMRRILVDHARRRCYRKHGGGMRRLTAVDVADPAARRDEDLLALDEALAELAAADGELAKVVELRFFGGLTCDEVAVALDLSPPTVHRRWRVARAWLYRRLAGSGPHAG